jgi:hypothetical protein
MNKPYSAYGQTIPTESNGGIPVNIQDQVTRPLDFYFTKANSNNSVTTTQPIVDSFTISVQDAIYSIGDFIGIFSGTGNFYFGDITAISAGTNLTVDSPFDFSFPIGSVVIGLDRNMNVLGTIGTPEIFSISPAAASGLSVDITRIIYTIQCNNSPNFDSFGDIINGLTQGVTLRRKNGTVENIYNIKSNGGFTQIAYDVQYFEQTQQQQLNGVACRSSFAGMDKHGVAIRLNAGDSLDLVIADDLSSLISFSALAQGHFITE